MIYFSGKSDSTKIKTSLVQNLEILKTLEKYLRNNFFEPLRENETSLLVFKKNKIDFKYVSKFETQVNKFFKIFSDNITSLKSESNNELIKQYKELDVLFEEEFFAINDYDNYKFENNKKLKELYNLTTV
jgi:hypothetical protein